MATFVFASDDMELAGEASNGREALELCALTRPDVVLLDVTLPDMSGAAATRVIREQWPYLQVIAMSSFQEEGQVPEVLEAGAAGYLLKNVSATELARTIRKAHAA